MTHAEQTDDLTHPASCTPLQTQIGGDHYKDMPIQPVTFIFKNDIPFLDGNVIKYVCRHRRKDGIEDLKKARHYIDLIIELEYEAKKK